MPNDLDGLHGIFSPGVDKTANFERNFATRGVPCFLIDGSVDGPLFSHPNLDFEKSGYAATRRVTRFVFRVGLTERFQRQANYCYKWTLKTRSMRS